LKQQITVGSPKYYYEHTRKMESVQ
jgi:hypothetical protein